MRHIALGIPILLVCLAASAVAAGTSPDSLRAEVARLDSIDTVYSPLVKRLTDQGRPVVPLLLEKLQSPRHLTALSAAWAIGQMADERNLPLLLETWAKAMNETLEYSNTMTALSMIMRDQTSGWRSIANEGVDPDVQLLLDAGLCPDADKVAHQRHGDSEARQPIVLGDQLSAGYRVSCFVEPAEIFQSRYPGESLREEAHGRKYVSFHFDILDIAEPSIPMPEWEMCMGEPPTCLAFVSVWRDHVQRPGWGGLSDGRGQESLWAKCAGTWRHVVVTQAIRS